MAAVDGVARLKADNFQRTSFLLLAPLQKSPRFRGSEAVLLKVEANDAGARLDSPSEVVAVGVVVNQVLDVWVVRVRRAQDMLHFQRQVRFVHAFNSQLGDHSSYLHNMHSQHYQ